MRIAGAMWTARRNVLRIECDCGVAFGHWADRWAVVCPKCKMQAGLAELRERYWQEYRIETGLAGLPE